MWWCLSSRGVERAQGAHRLLTALVLLLVALSSVNASVEYEIDGVAYRATMSQLWYEGYWKEVRHS